MRQPTIAERRKREIPRLVAFKTSTPTDADFAEARTLMNSFYRLCGLSERNLYLANEERTCNLASTKRSEEKEDKWHRRLDKAFRDTYGLRLVYVGYAPSIFSVDEQNRLNREEIQRFFYD